MKPVRNFLLFIPLLLMLSSKTQGQNLINLENWYVNNFSSFDFEGNDEDNGIFLNSGPHNGSIVPVWSARGSTGSHPFTGVNFSLSLNTSKTYRFSIWVKSNHNNGDFLFGVKQSSQSNLLTDLKNSDRTTAYFYDTPLPGASEKWVLFVAYIHPQAYNLNQSIGGAYELGTGNKIGTLNDYKFKNIPQPGRALFTWEMHHSTDGNPNEIFNFYSPRLEEVNGTELPLFALLNLAVSPAQSGEEEKYFKNNVGIKTQDTKGYELAVNGKIRSQEVRVEIADWPDYVFKKDYDLTSLEETAKFIEKNGHLPGVPSAEDIENEGLSLGEINKLLMKKIEELTLHVLELNNKIKATVQ